MLGKCSESTNANTGTSASTSIRSALMHFQNIDSKCNRSTSTGTIGITRTKSRHKPTNSSLSRYIIEIRIINKYIKKIVKCELSIQID